LRYEQVSGKIAQPSGKISRAGVIGWTLLFELDTLGTCPQQSGLANGNFGGIMNSIFGHCEDKD